MKKWIKDYLTFSKRERIGLFSLLMVMGLFLYLPSLLKTAPPVLQATDTAWVHQLWQNNAPDTAVMQLGQKQQGHPNDELIQPTDPFYFDPNSATERELIQLGLTSKNAQTIVHYRQKGGRFKTPKDLLKIWGIKPDKALALLPYIKIKADGYIPYAAGMHKRGGFNQPYTPKPIPTIQMASASATDWELLPGIGPVLAQRIIKYRDKIGGFTEKADLLKVYGISDSLFQHIQPYLSLQVMGKPSINTANEAMLVKAGVPQVLAQAIVQYRTQYGSYRSLEDLKQIVFIQPAQYQQLLDLVKL